MNGRIVVDLPRGVRRWLQQTARRTRDARLRTRVQIVLLYARGWGAQRIATALNCAPATAVRVVHRFLEHGEDGVFDGRRDNGCPKVDADLLQALAELTAGSAEDHGWSRPTWTRESLAKSLAEQTGVVVSVTTVARMLAGLRARWGMARPTVACPWSKARKRRHLRRIERMVATLPRGEVAYYEDEVDIHLNPRIGRDWMLRGQQKTVLTPGKNQKRYLAGALAADGSDLVFVRSERKNSALFLALLDKLGRVHPGARRIHLILDNYTIHSSRCVQAYLRAHGERFVLHFLPPYSPEHNRIERAWRELHANVTRNHRCRTMEELMQRVVWYLQREARRLRLRSGAKRSTPARTRAAA